MVETYDAINLWLKSFMDEKFVDDEVVVDDEYLRSLAGALCDDIPLGYEASHRLAAIIFTHLNQPKISDELLKQINDKINHHNLSRERLYNALDEFNKDTNEILEWLRIIKEE